jgi:multidrug efflux pump subunit AcrA (membrane-fusion protein)
MNVSRPARAIAACLFVAVAGCDHGSADSASQAAAGPKKREPARVRTAAVEQREMVKTLSTTTVVESEHEVKLVPRTTGIVTELFAEEGDRVKEGDVLAVLDRRLTKAMIEDAKVALREAEDSVAKSDIAKSEADSRIVTAQIKYDQTVRDYDRNAKANLISAQALDNLAVQRDTAKNELETAKISAQSAEIATKAVRTTLEKTKLALQRAELDDTFREINAPFDGVIASRSIHEGDLVGAGGSVFVLTDVNRLRAVVYRPQRELSMFLAARRPADDANARASAHAPEDHGSDAPATSAEGAAQPAEKSAAGADGTGTAITDLVRASPEHTGTLLEIRAVPEALPGSVFRGDLQLVSPSIDAQSGSFRVTIRMGEPIEGPKDARLLPGMLVRVEIVTERHPDALVVPKRALRREGEQNLLFVVKDGKARKVEVEEGFSDDASVEVHLPAGALLVAGEHVVVVGNRELEDGAEVMEENVPDPTPRDDDRTTGDSPSKTRKG